MRFSMKQTNSKTQNNYKKNTGIGYILKAPTFVVILWLFSGSLSAQITVQGTVINSFTRQPVDFATIVLPEQRIKQRVFSGGQFTLVLPEAGSYRVVVTSPGLQMFDSQVQFNDGQPVTISMTIARVTGDTITVKGERDIQKVSRNTLSQQDLKEAPATFGDSIGALATLPGVIRTGGFFGTLTIRGAADTANRYYIDDIPVPNPQHFGAIQSVISNDIVSEIDLYSSAFPVLFGQATGAVIDINTVDEVKKFKGVIDLSIISSNFYLHNTYGDSEPSPDGNMTITDAQIEQEVKQTQKASRKKPQGYYITAARVGYLSLIVPPLYKLITGDSIASLPEYYDYQLKGKTFLDNKGNHSLTLLLFGSYDTLKFLQDEITAEEEAKRREEGADPLLDTFNIKNDIHSHSQGIYYDFRPSSKFHNRLMVFNSYTKSLFYTAVSNENITDRVINVDITPGIAGIKNKTRLDWGNGLGKLQTGLEARYYYFGANGQTQSLTRPSVGQGNPDFADNTLFQTVDLDFNIKNITAHGYLQNRFAWGGLKLVPGVRFDYLDRTQDLTTGPRALAAYTFETDTTIAAAGGMYHGFAQTNSFLFNQIFNQQPQVAIAENIEPEESLHRTLSIEQKLDLFTVKLEGFMNDFDKQPLQDPRPSENLYYSSTGKTETRGVELLLRKDRLESANDLYGWLSYTYTEARSILDPGKPDTWYTSPYEMTHSLKLVAGYKWGLHNLGARFELSSGLPYTPIVGSYQNSGFSPARYSPLYGTPYSKKFDFSHRLDIRYTQTRNYSWGTFRWYVEVINIYNYAPKNNVNFKYNQPYSEGVNPSIEASDGLNLIPNFGVEWRF